MIRVLLLIQIPWRSLGQSPVIVEIDSIFLLACPKTEADVIADEAAAVILPSHPVPSQDAYCGGCTFVTRVGFMHVWMSFLVYFGRLLDFNFGFSALRWALPCRLRAGPELL